MKIISGGILFVLLISNIYAQNLYDLTNSLKYADYLYKAQEYKLAAQEYERIVYMSPENADATFKLVKSYELSLNYNTAINRTLKYYPESCKMPANWAKEYSKLLIKNNNFQGAISHTSCSINLLTEDKVFYNSVSLCMDNKWNNAIELLNSTSNTDNKNLIELRSVVLNRQNMNFKSVPVSIALSTIIPGLGKVYSGYWKDGLFSFIIVGISGIQAYRGFQKNGLKSTYGWLYFASGFSFYIGNIYGAGKAANKHNSNLNHKIIHRVENIFESYN